MANQHTPKLPKIVRTVEDTVPLHEINVPESVQSRVQSFDEGAVTRYVEALENGDKLPPVELFTWDAEDGWDGTPYFVGAGFHRIEAYRRYGKKEIPATCTVIEGGRENAYAAAQWCSVTSNATHGLPRTQADRRRAVKLAIEAQPHLNDSRIAKLVRVDSKTVARVRAEMEGRPDPYAEEKPANPEREPVEADSLEKVQEKARKAVEAVQPFTTKRRKELAPVTTAIDAARTSILEAAREVVGAEEDVQPVLQMIYAYLERCGEGYQ